MDHKADAIRLVKLYGELVKAAKHGDTSRTQAAKNAAKLLASNQATMADLEQAVRNYANTCRILGRDYLYRKNAGNFFGREEVFRQFVPSEYEAPTSQRTGPTMADGRSVQEAIASL